MTWQVPGAEVEIIEFPIGKDDLVPTFAVGLTVTVNGQRVAFGSDTATALAACLVDAAHRIDERTAHALQARKQLARKTLEQLRAEQVRDYAAPGHEAYVKHIAEGYASDIEGRR